MSNRRVIVAAITALVLIVGCTVFFAFYDDIAGAINASATSLAASSSSKSKDPKDDSSSSSKKPESDKSNDKSTDKSNDKSDSTTGERHYVFLTYSEEKLGCYNFFDDCYAKAEAAVKEGKAESVQGYVLDENFDKNAYAKAEAAVKAGKAETIVEAMSQHEDAGKISYMLYYDPAFTAAIATALDMNGISGMRPILKEEKDLPASDRPDAALQRFMKSFDDWDEARQRIINLLWAKNTKTELKEMADYTSGMYMYKDGIKLGVPSVIIRSTTNSGGHFILFTIEVEKDVWKTIRFRLECGYQPVDVPDIPVPSTPPVPDNPTPTVPSTTPQPQPKNPAKDPQNAKGAENHEFYSPDRVNHDPDKTPTEEPVSPTKEYVAPAPPTPEPTKPTESTKPTETAKPTDSTKPAETKPTTAPATPTTQPEASKNTQSGSKTQDTDNGKTETHDGKTYNVEAGNGKNNGDLGQIAEPTNPNKPDVEPALADDPINTKAVTNFE